MLVTMFFAFLAGVLSLLSPCVLPLLPIVIGAAASQHRLGPLALSGGLALSFTVIGILVATIGFAVGLDESLFRTAAAILLVAIGAILLVPAFQARFALAASPVGAWTESRFGGFSTDGWTGQFGVGLLLGAVWSPCVGPTLGVASLAAARSENLLAIAVTMMAFGLGAAFPLLCLGRLSREALLRWRDGMRGASGPLRQFFGGLLVVAGVLILTGSDKRVEAALVEASPEWLTALTTMF
jgi:cytochrome c biogenesis protein CcdA